MRTSRKKVEERKRRRENRSAAKARRASPYQAAGSRSQDQGWYINRDWQEDGVAYVAALRRAPDGHLVLAAFLIDVWCTGLKDAWGRFDLTVEEWEEWFGGVQDHDMDMISVDGDLARRLVAGGIRFARQNGFRLPRRYERWVALAGGVGDVASADLGLFGKDGGLLYVGSVEDLQQRLVGCPVAEFLDRQDVHFITGPDQPGPSDDEMEGVEEGLEHARERAVHAVNRWCRSNGLQPHPRLPDVLDIVLEAASQTPDLGGGEPDFDRGAELMTRALEMAPGPESVQLVEAMQQLVQFMSQFPSPDAFIAAVRPEE